MPRRPLRASNDSKLGVQMDRAGEVRERSADAALVEAARGAPAAFYQFRLSSSGTFAIPFASPDFAARLGIELGAPEETAALFFSRVHPDDLKKITDGIAQSARTLETFESEFRYRHPSGVETWLEARSNPRRMPDGSVAWNGVITDITERRRTEEALRESEARLRLFVRHAPAALAMFDRDMRYITASLRWLSDYGLADRDVTGLSHYEVLPEIPERWKETHRRGLAGEVVRADEDPFERADGSIQWIRWEIRPWRTEGRDVGGIVIFAEDITARRTAAESLRRKEEILEQAQSVARAGSWTSEIAARTLDVSPECARLVGWKPGLHQFEELFTIIHPEDVARMKTAWTAALTGAPYDIEHRVVVNGEVRWLHARARLESGPDGEAVRAIGVSQDVTSNHQAEEALRASEERFRAIFDVAPVGVAQADPATGRWVAVNPRMCLITGYTADELLTMRVPEITHPEDRDRDWELFQRVVKGETAEYRIEKRYVRKDGSIAWVNVNMVVLRDAAGQPTRTVAMIEDITERKRTEANVSRLNTELEDAFQWQRHIFEGSRDAVFLSDEEGRFVAVNGAATELTGFSREELLRMSIPDLHDDPDLAAYRAFQRRILDGEQVLSEAPIRRKDGAKVAVEFNNSVVAIGGNRFMHTAARDVTERARAIRRLTLQAEMGRVLAESGNLAEAIPRILRALGESEGMAFGAWWEPHPDSRMLRCAHVWSADPEQCAMLAAATRALELEPGEGIPGTVWATRRAFHVTDLTKGKGPPRVPHAPRGPAAARAGLNSAVAFPLLRQGEPVGVVEFFAAEIRDLDPALAASVAMLGGQIALYLERRRAEEASARFLAASPAVIYALRIAPGGFRVSWFSENILALTGFTHAEVVAGRPDRWLEQGIHPDDLARVVAANDSVIHVGHATVEFRFRHKDGSWLWVHDEKRILFDAENRPGEVVGSWVDVTARVRLEEQLRQAQKMEAIGQLAGGVAHDFNNLLTVISGNTDLLLSDFPADDPKRGPLTDIRAAGARAANLTRQLLAFSRKQILEPKLVDVHEVISGIEKMLGRLIGEDVELVTDLVADPSWVKVDPGQLEQVVMNLAVNARDAMPRGGRLTIRTRTLDPNEPVNLEETASRRLSPKIAISISDTGTGIPPEVKPHLFEPFFTTKPVGKGTGLGLATVYGIVKQSGGDVTVESEPGTGATFTIVLPSRPAPRRVDGSGASLRAVPRGTETVLVVEDEDAVRRIVRIALETTGYRVIEARTGPEALAAARKHAGGIHIVVTDVVMPEMSGRELAERIAKEQPGVRILYMSGYTDDAVVRHGIVESGVAFLQKPFSPLALARKVRETLDAKA